MNGYLIAWVDTTIITEKPRLSPYIEEMKTALSRAGIPTGLINIKAKTNEDMGFIGRGEGMAAQAVCLLSRV
jgi:2-C-methyl-D-erythritol 2,4-cyclodiphosphate synthase